MVKFGHKTMGINGFLLLILVLLIALTQSVVSNEEKGSSNHHHHHHHPHHLHHVSINSFPKGFLFGTASASYQFEGAADEDGREPSIWDTFTKRHPEKIKDHRNGNKAVDQYNRYQEDVALMKDIGFNSYRFSISWSRILPNGTLSGGVNTLGIQYYSDLIDELQSKGIEPFVTLFHWDLPQALEDVYGGFLSPNIVKDFTDYAEVCFKKLGNRVKHWITLNEPLTYCVQGYATGAFAPGRCSKSLNCTDGNSGTEPYLAAHNQLLAHASVVKLYREKYQKSQMGEIGITLNTGWIVPYSNSKVDMDAAERALAFNYGWFFEPIFSGSYPTQMVQNVGKRLPSFTKEESAMLKGSYDFVGVNYYSGSYAAGAPCNTNAEPSYSTDSCVKVTNERNGVPIGLKTSLGWLLVYPKGIEELLVYTKNKYNNPVIYITENGVVDVPHDSDAARLEDQMRVDYYNEHLLHLLNAMKAGVNVKGYYAWSLLDNFEWAEGYTARFGIVFVDFDDDLKRIPKKSALWFQKFFLQQNHTLLSSPDKDVQNEF